MATKTTIFTHRLRISLARLTFCWWRHNRLLMKSQWLENCDSITWKVISNSLDIDFIYGDIHGRSCQNTLLAHAHARRTIEKVTVDIPAHCKLSTTISVRNIVNENSWRLFAKAYAQKALTTALHISQICVFFHSKDPLRMHVFAYKIRGTN